jgi:hypothetical protein
MMFLLLERILKVYMKQMGYSASRPEKRGVRAKGIGQKLRKKRGSQEEYRGARNGRLGG